MSELVVRGRSAQRVERFQSLLAGQYWRALRHLADEGIGEGEVLLIQSIRYVEERMHTIILRPHPDRFAAGRTVMPHRFLLADFLNAFEFEPDAAAIRAAELLARQREIQSSQADLQDLQSDPARMRD
jgi:hypothetical protein